MADAQQSMIEGLNKQFVEAFKTRDFAAVAAMFADDAVLLPPRRNSVTGRDNIQRFWTRSTRIKDLRFESESFTGLAGDVARDIGTLRMRMEPGRGRRERQGGADDGTRGQPQELFGKYVFVWRKIGGEWRLETGIWHIGRQSRARPERSGRRRARE